MDNQTLALVGVICGAFLVAILLMQWERRHTLATFAKEWGSITRTIIVRLPESFQDGFQFVETGIDKAKEIAHDLPLPDVVKDGVDLLDEVADNLIGEGESEVGDNAEG